MRQGPLIVEVFRGDYIESHHLVDAVVVDESGRLVHAYGEVERLVYPRSAIKMPQALALMEVRDRGQWPLPKRWISLACASHQGEPIHTEEVHQWLSLLELDESALECGAHDPYDETTKREMIRRGESPSVLHNNCSGKHCGLLMGLKLLGENIKGYSHYEHSCQVRLRRILGEVSALDYDKAPWGIDGCGIPTYAIPLDGLARSLAFFIPHSPLARGSTLRGESAQEIRQAIIEEPDMISGTRGLCSKIIRVSGGRAIAKPGAEGVYAGLIPGQGFAMALKVRDGAGRASEQVMLYLLQKLNGLADTEISKIDLTSMTQIKNWAGKVVGRSEVKLRKT